MKPMPAKPRIIMAQVEGSGTAAATGMGSVIPDVEEYSNPARELPEGVRSVTVMLSDPDVNPALAAIAPLMKVEVPPDLVMVLRKLPRFELGPGVN
jgi:hypothetical protein